ncbi:Mss4-like protein [Cokeromyces recurvatus]|uniref:Mss4-like protein n=1 Tax=Cokeromyces recurvatus TaxID=90255 RepID=UPI0022210A98|nr:Mss4-like protein [Cokeromyces recurvatus]KAI7906186.1 Mss4-like protein [Cokeromyces recurvatus]
MSSTSFGKAYQGTCLCKSIKVLLDGPPVKTLLCHCLDCQKSAGAPYQSCAIYPTSRVQVIDPDQSLKYYITPKEKVSSGSEKYIFFCGVCGTPLFNRPMSHEGEKTVIKTGFLDRIDKEPG